MLEITPHLLVAKLDSLPVGTVVSFYALVTKLTESFVEVCDLAHREAKLRVLLKNYVEIESGVDEGVIVLVVASVSDTKELITTTLSSPDPKTLGNITSSVRFIETRAKIMLKIHQNRSLKVRTPPHQV